MRYRLIAGLFLICTACSGPVEQNIGEQVDQYIAEDRYEQALALIEQVDSTETDADLERLREKTHLNYGIWLEYRGPEGSTMRDRMTSALEQYIAVLRINPVNGKAIEEIDQIMGVYSTMPGRTPDEEILSDLRDLGFDY